MFAEFVLTNGRRTSVHPAHIVFVTEMDDADSLTGYSGPLTTIGVAGDADSYFSVRGSYLETLAILAKARGES